MRTSRSDEPASVITTAQMRNLAVSRVTCTSRSDEPASVLSTVHAKNLIDLSRQVDDPACRAFGTGPGVAAKVVVVARSSVSDAPLGEPFRVLAKESAQKVSVALDGMFSRRLFGVLSRPAYREGQGWPMFTTGI